MREIKVFHGVSGIWPMWTCCDPHEPVCSSSFEEQSSRSEGADMDFNTKRSGFHKFHILAHLLVQAWQIPPFWPRSKSKICALRWSERCATPTVCDWAKWALCGDGEGLSLVEWGQGLPHGGCARCESKVLVAVATTSSCENLRRTGLNSKHWLIFKSLILIGHCHGPVGFHMYFRSKLVWMSFLAFGPFRMFSNAPGKIDKGHLKIMDLMTTDLHFGSIS